MILYCKIPFRRAWQFRTATERCLMPKIMKLSVFCDPVLQDTVPSRLASSHRDGTVNLPNHYFQHPTNHTAPRCAVPFLACVRSPISRHGRSPGTTLNLEKMDSAWFANRLVTRWYIARFNCRNRLNVGNLILRKDMFNECGFREFPTGVCSLRVGSKLSKTLPNCLGYLL